MKKNDKPALQSPTKNENFAIKIKDFENIFPNPICVVDCEKRCFNYVSDNFLSLCGYSKDEVMRLGDEFYSEIVHRDDLPLLKDMHRVVYGCLNEPGSANHEIHHFSCTLRIKTRLSKGNKPAYSMICLKLVPQLIDVEIKYVCILSDSGVENAENLRRYYKNSSSFDEYSFAGKQWKTHAAEHLLNAEQAIPRFAKQDIKSNIVFHTYKIDIPAGEGCRKIYYYSDILYIDCDDPYSEIHCIDGDRLLVNCSLKTFVSVLPNIFFQCNKSAVVNLSKIKDYDKKNDTITLENGDRISLSRRKAADFKNLINSVPQLREPFKQCFLCNSETACCQDFRAKI